jgi:hypothetical protein
LVGDEDDLILDCYRLAREYHVSPEIFLNMPISDVHLHIGRTHQLYRKQRPVSDDEE